MKRGKEWSIDGHLKGHEKSINICRFNPIRMKAPGPGSDTTNLVDTYYLATSGGDSNIAIWRASDKNPFFIAKQAFLSGVNDLTWGVNGQVLFGCSNDGEIMMCHFQPGLLGECMSDSEIEQVIMLNYGEMVFTEYKKFRKINIIKDVSITETSSKPGKLKHISS